MKTPWGALFDLNLDDHGIAEKIISADKHQLVEGLVVECLFDQIAQTVQTTSDSKIVPLDVETIIVDTNRELDRWIAFVWVRTKTEGLGRYLLALESEFVPYLLEYNPSLGFTAIKREKGKSVGEKEVLSTLMMRISRGNYKEFKVDMTVKDEARQKQAFWGFLSNYYKNRMKDQIVLSRLLINYGIQPYFRRVWNLDRVFLVDGQLWLLEVKHKFPMELPPKQNFPTLRFGINEGELNVINKLVRAKIRCLHTILVKPFWSKEVGSMYLLNDLSLRGKTALIATEISQITINNMRSRKPGKSGAHTTITGESGISFRSLPAGSFQYLGLLQESPERLARNMVALMSGEKLEFVTEKQLQDIRSNKFD